MTEAELKYVEEEFERLFEGSEMPELEKATAYNRVLLGFAMCRTFDKLQDKAHEDWLDDLEQEKALSKGEG